MGTGIQWTSRWLGVLLLAMACTGAVTPASAQTNVGQIAGRVVDTSGAALPGATITAVSDETGLTSTTVSDTEGNYVFAALTNGHYTMRAQLENFQSSEQSGVILDAASRRTVNFELTVGNISESVSVVALAGQVETRSGDVSRVITGEQVGSMALNGRNYSALLQLLPGASTTTTDTFSLGLSTTGQTINGVRSSSIYFTVDGADNVDNGANGSAIISPALDTISEVKVLTSSYAAEFGGRAGAMVNVVTRSGTREFHGSGYEFARNDKFDARNFFDAQKAPLTFNNVGYTIGGPVLLPGGFNKDRSKMFFFFGQDWKKSHLGDTRIGTVPTAAERNGDFRNSSLAAPIDPLTGQPFPNRIVPADRWAKNGAALLAPYPLPNYTGAGGNYRTTGTQQTDTREETMRLDYLLSSSTQASFRFTHDQVDIYNPYQGSDLGIVPGTRPRPGWNLVGSVQQAFSPTLLNYASFSVTKNQIRATPDNSLMSRSALGLTYPELYPGSRFGTGPDVTMAGFTSYNAGDYIINRNMTYQWRDDLSKVAGRHTFKFGTQITYSAKDQNTRPRDNGAVNFNSSSTNSTGNVVADALLGRFNTYSEGDVDQQWLARYQQYEFYAQDNWQVSNRLTLEMGLRYNIIAPIYSALNNFSTFDASLYNPANAPRILASDGSIVPGTGSLTNGIVIFGDGFPKDAAGKLPAASDPAAQALFGGRPRGGVPTSYTDFGPRLGVAYDLFGDGKTALRGGFGIFYDRTRTDFLSGSASNPPFARSAQIFSGNIDDPSGGSARSFPPNLDGLLGDLPTPRYYMYNVGIQREVLPGTILHVNYVGTLGRHLSRDVNINQLPVGTRLNPPASTTNVNALRPYPGYADIVVTENEDSSNYNSLQLSATRRMHAGLELGANYTWSKTMDTTNGTIPTGQVQSPQDYYNIAADYALSSVHRAHNLNGYFIWQIPFLRQNGNRVVRGVLGGWDINGVFVYQSGAPFTVTVPVDIARNGNTSSRATVIGDPSLPSSDRTPSHWFNTAAFLPPGQMTPGQYGDGGRNILIGPAFSRIDLGLAKEIGLPRGFKVQLRMEAFNVINHASFTSLNTVVRFDNAGNPTGGFGAATAAAPGRVLEFGARLTF